MLTYYERGELMGRFEALKEIALLQLEARFGLLSLAVKQRVEAMSEEQLRDLLLALVRSQTLTDLGLDS